jgi:hypothetical protein
MKKIRRRIEKKQSYFGQTASLIFDYVGDVDAGYYVSVA